MPNTEICFFPYTCHQYRPIVNENYGAGGRKCQQLATNLLSFNISLLQQFTEPRTSVLLNSENCQSTCIMATVYKRPFYQIVESDRIFPDSECSIYWHTLSSVGWRSAYCCRVLAAEDYHHCHSAISHIAHHDFSSNVTSFCRTPVFCLRFANCRQTQQDGQITEHVSLAQSELRWTTWSAVEWLDCRL